MPALSELIQQGLDNVIIDGRITIEFKSALSICEKRDRGKYYQLNLDEIDNETCVEIVCGAIQQNRRNPDRQRLLISLAFNNSAEEKLLCQLFDALLAYKNEKDDLIIYGGLEVDKCPKFFVRCLENLSRYQHLELSFYSFNDSHLQQLVNAFKKSKGPLDLSLEIITEEDISKKEYEPLKNYFQLHKLLLEINDKTFDYRSTYPEKSTYHVVTNLIGLMPQPLIVTSTVVADNNNIETRQIRIKIVERKILKKVENSFLAEQKRELAEKTQELHENPMVWLDQFLTQHPLGREGKWKLSATIEKSFKELTQRIEELEKNNKDIVMEHDLNKVAETIEQNNHEMKAIRNFIYTCRCCLRKHTQPLAVLPQDKRLVEIAKDQESKRQKLLLPEIVEHDEELQQAIALSLGKL